MGSGIQQGTGTEVGREGTGACFEWQVKQREWVGIADYKTEGCRVGLPLAVECLPEGGWAGFHTAAGDGKGQVGFHKVVVGEGQVAMKSTPGVELRQVL